MRSAMNYEKQVLLHSLLLQSALRFESFYNSAPERMIDAFLFLNIGDGRPNPDSY